MNKLLIAATALFALASCAKEQVNDTQTPAADGGNVMVSFVAEPNTTRAFFDPSTATEV